MYADLERIEARGKRKKEKRKGFFSRGKTEKEPEPAVASTSKPAVASTPEPAVVPTSKPVVAPKSEPVVAPTPEPIPEPRPIVEPTPPPQVPPVDDAMVDMSLESPPATEPVVHEKPDYCDPNEKKQQEPTAVSTSEPAAVPTPKPAAVPTPEPVPEPSPIQDSSPPDVDPMDMLEFSSSTAEEGESPDQQPPGTDPFGPPADPAGFSSMPVAPEPEQEQEVEEVPDTPPEVITLESDPAPEPAPEPIAPSVPEPVPTVVEPTPAPTIVPDPAPQPAPAAEAEPTPPVQAPPTPEPAVSPPEPTPVAHVAPAKLAWQPIEGQEKVRAEAHIQEYRTWLNKGYKAGKFTKQECQIKLKHKEVELGLRQHQ